MRKIVTLTLTLLLAMRSIPTVYASDSVASQITAMPAGTQIEVRLKNKQTVRGATGPVSPTGFTITDASRSEHQIAFDDVSSLKPISKSHTKRNVLIGVAIGVAALGISAGLIARCAPFGCGTHHF